MPTSIEISIQIGHRRFTEVARIPVEIPGERVKALTSTYSIVREEKFSLRDWKEDKKLRKLAIKEIAKEGQQTRQKEKDVFE